MISDFWYRLPTAIRVSYVGKRRWKFMMEQELLDLFIQERVNMLLAKLSKNRPDKSPKEQKRILKTEHFIDNLPEKERNLVQNYMERFTNWLAEEEPYLYQQGFMDGVRVLNYLRTL